MFKQKVSSFKVCLSSLPVNLSIFSKRLALYILFGHLYIALVSQVLLVSYFCVLILVIIAAAEANNQAKRIKLEQVESIKEPTDDLQADEVRILTVLNSGFRIRFVAKFGSRALYLEQREILNIYIINILDKSKGLNFCFQTLGGPLYAPGSGLNFTESGLVFCI